MIGQFCHVRLVYCTIYAGRLQYITLVGSMDMVRDRVRVRVRVRLQDWVRDSLTPFNP